MIKTAIIATIIGARNLWRAILTLWQLWRRRDFDSLQSVHLWLRSLLPWHTPLSDEAPWIPFKARKWLESYLKPDMTVFEYGSGGSTIFLAQRAKELISIEHDKEWYNLVSSALRKKGISNCKYFLHEPEKIFGETPSYGCQSYTSTRMKGFSLMNYVKSIERYQDGSFDLVIVDGRARASCVFHALNKIRDGGYLMLDNSARQEYDEAKSLLADYKRTDFSGLTPYSTSLSQTSVWEIKRRFSNTCKGQ
ncbi:MAG TPA: class I SAM-dependent methyltransferase [Dehalococcoidia bacterium]|jgi:hypothetical protein|nr:class I SAM-dependent methyltransferase [Dehalococcoidia bacterium]